MFLFLFSKIKIEKFRCNNALGENKKFAEKLSDLQKNLITEYSAPGTPQQNGVVERAFATLYGRVRAMMMYTKMKGEIRRKLWAECANIATHLDKILIPPNEKKSSYQKIHYRNPMFINNLRVFGEVGIILPHKRIGFKSELDEKGPVGIFVY